MRRGLLRVVQPDGLSRGATLASGWGDMAIDNYSAASSRRSNREDRRSATLIARFAGGFLLVFGLLPIVNWIPGGHEAPWYWATLREWASGTTMLALVAAAVWILGRRLSQEQDGEPGWRRLARRVDSAGWRGDIGIGCLAFALAAAIAWFVFSARPLLIDEIIQVVQARIFASGALWTPSPDHPEFTSSTHLLDLEGRRFAQFPPGWSLLIVPFTLLRIEWLAGPLLFGVAAVVFLRLLRQIEPDASTRVLAGLLFVISPFVAFLGASHMNHLPTVALLLFAALGLAHLVNVESQPSPAWGLLTGLALGSAATIRPTDAMAFALPTAGWLLWRALRDHRQVVPMLASGVGVAIPIALMLGYNAATTGDPFLFGYTAHWGPSHGLGFHEAPWGESHTPARGLELVNLYLLRLQFHLFELPVPGLLLVVAGLWSARRVTAFDRWAMVACASLLLAYFAYWHDGYFLGPRFVLPLAPWLVLWVARLPAALRERDVPLRLRRTLAAATGAAVAWALVTDIPFRVAVYGAGLQTMRWDADAAVRAAGAEGVVLVRESWGAQTVARLRALGVPAEEIEWLYRGQDSCDLELLVTEAESLAGASRDSAIADLSRLARQRNAGLVALPEASDTSLRWMPGRQPAPVCLERFREMQAGFTLYAPLLLAETDVQFVRDLHARDTLLFGPGEEPGWLLIGDPVGAEGPRLIRLDVDSTRESWGRRAER